MHTCLKVPYTALAGMSSGKILPEVREAYEAVEKFHLVSSYGIQHRMIPPAGRPEIIIEGSMDKKTWMVRACLDHPWLSPNGKRATSLSSFCLLGFRGILEW